MALRNSGRSSKRPSRSAQHQSPANVRRVEWGRRAKSSSEKNSGVRYLIRGIFGPLVFWFTIKPRGFTGGAITDLVDAGNPGMAALQTLHFFNFVFHDLILP